MKHMFTFFEDFTEGADFYQNNGSLWLIFTEQKKWVFELTKNGTLWYNYYFFDKIFNFASLGLIENQNYITQWVEDTIQNVVEHTEEVRILSDTSVEYTIQNGVKHTNFARSSNFYVVEDTIQNEAKETNFDKNDIHLWVEDAIQNGVKKTNVSPTFTEYGDWLDGDERLDDIIQNGIKKTKQEEHHRLREVVRTVKDGVKETNWRCVDNHPSFVDSVIESGVNETWGYTQQPQNRINEVIKNGTKENPS